MHACNLSTWDAEAGGLQARGKPGLCMKVLPPKTNKKTKKKKRNYLAIKGKC